MQFYLGSHRPDWLWREYVNVPLFVSRRRLAGRKTLGRALTNWALDSGGFTELGMYGKWTLPPADYAREVRRFRDEIGNLDYAAPQDWMCEAVMLAKTGKTIADHQALTVDNYLELTTIAPDLPWIPVLQGWTLGDYYACFDRYERHGVDLTALPMVGVGTVCRRQGMAEAVEIVSRLADEGVNLHGFGFKLTGLAKVGHRLAAADSMAWSYAARRSPPLSGCVGHINCANCHHYALLWLNKVKEVIAC